MRTILEGRTSRDEKPGLLERRWFIGLLIILLLIALACAVILIIYPDLPEKILGGGRHKLHLIPK